MPNWCSNNIVVTGPVEDIAHFTQMCIRLDENGNSCFDFTSLIPMPAILTGTVAGGPVDDALVILGRDDLVMIPCSLEERMKGWDVSDHRGAQKEDRPRSTISRRKIWGK